MRKLARALIGAAVALPIAVASAPSTSHAQKKCGACAPKAAKSAKKGCGAAAKKSTKSGAKNKCAAGNKCGACSPGKR